MFEFYPQRHLGNCLCTKIFLSGLLSVCGLTHGADPVPVVIWHGMGDSCCNPSSMGSIKVTFFIYNFDDSE